MRTVKVLVIGILILTATFVCGCADRVFNYALDKGQELLEDQHGHGHQPDSTQCDSAESGTSTSGAALQGRPEARAGHP